MDRCEKQKDITAKIGGILAADIWDSINELEQSKFVKVDELECSKKIL